jgi:hypothetical protein
MLATNPVVPVNRAESTSVGETSVVEISLRPSDEAVAWVEEFLDSLSPETHAILQRPTRRMLHLIPR